MVWARMLAYITGTVDQERLLRNECLAAENRILKAQISTLWAVQPLRRLLGKLRRIRIPKPL